MAEGPNPIILGIWDQNQRNIKERLEPRAGDISFQNKKCTRVPVEQWVHPLGSKNKPFYLQYFNPLKDSSIWSLQTHQAPQRK